MAFQREHKYLNDDMHIIYPMGEHFRRGPSGRISGFEHIDMCVRHGFYIRSTRTELTLGCPSYLDDLPLCTSVLTLCCSDTSPPSMGPKY